MRWEKLAGAKRRRSGSVSFSSVQSFSRVWLFVTSWTAACQASLSITNSQSLLKLTSIESVMPSNHLILCRLLLPAFNLSQHQGLFKWQYAKGLTLILSVLWLSWQELCRRFTWSDWNLEMTILQCTYHFQWLLFSVSSHHEHLPVRQRGNVVCGMFNLKLVFEELWLYLY